MMWIRSRIAKDGSFKEISTRNQLEINPKLSRRARGKDLRIEQIGERMVVFPSVGFEISSIGRYNIAMP